MTRVPISAVEALEAYAEAGAVVARALEAYTTVHAFPEDLRQLALEKAIINFGEAAARLDKNHPWLGKDYPALDVSAAISMRAVLAHDYDQIRADILQQAAAEDVPKATESAEAVLRALRAAPARER